MRVSASKPVVVRPWYREPFVWMVIGGPLVVVIASIVTVMIAVRHQDPVLAREPERLEQALPADAVNEEERLQAQKALLPATQGRNHVVSPSLPKTP
jgi:hypothetical protein